MKSSNPFMGSLAKSQGRHPFAQQGGQQNFHQQGYPQGYGAQYGQGAYGGYTMTQQGMYAAPDAANYGQAGAADRPMTVDDVVAKTGITLAVIIVMAAITYLLGSSNPGMAMGLTAIGAIGGLITVMISSFGNKYGPVTTLVYAVFEGLFVGGFSFAMANLTVSKINAGALISQAVLGTIGVFIGMLFVYKTGAIRVTPKFTRFMVGALIGVCVLALGNLVFALFTHGAGPLRDGGPIAIIFSLVCIGIAAMSFLLDFDQADRMIRAGAPSKMAWGVAMGLAVTLVWLYTEILRLLSILSND